MMLAGMMSPPSGYSSGDEDRPAYANADVLASVQEEVQRLQAAEAAREAARGPDGGHTSAASAPAVLLNCLAQAGSASSGSRLCVRDASPGGSDDGATPSSSSISVAGSPRAAPLPAGRARVALPPQALGMVRVTEGERASLAQQHAPLATPIRAASLPPSGGSAMRQSAMSKPAQPQLPASPLKRNSRGAGTQAAEGTGSSSSLVQERGIALVSLQAPAQGMTGDATPSSSNTAAATLPKSMAGSSQEAPAPPRGLEDSIVPGGIPIKRSISPSSSSSAPLQLGGSLGGLSSDSAAVPPPTTPSPQEAASVPAQQATPPPGGSDNLLDDPLSVDQPESIGLMGDQQAEGEQQEEEDEDRDSQLRAAMVGAQGEGEGHQPHSRTASQVNDVGTNLTGASAPQPAPSLAGSSIADGYLGDVEPSSHAPLPLPPARHEHNISMQSDTQLPQMLPLSPQPPLHQHQGQQRTLLQNGHPAGVAPLSPFQVSERQNGFTC